MAKRTKKEKIEDVLWRFRSGELTVDQAHEKICDANDDEDDGGASAEDAGPPTGGNHPGSGGTP